MDPVTQGVLGAAAALLVSKQDFLAKGNNKVNVTLAGCLGGLAADLDILITSSSDPLLALDFHRHFTHSLFFIPIGGLLVALFLWATFFRKTPFKQTYLYSTVGYATHALLDSCTTYGTKLFLPFSDKRVAWDTISVIDPIVTIPLLIAVIITYRTSHKKWLNYGAVFFAVYMSFGVLQNYRAIESVKQLAVSNAHEVLRIRAMPTLGNLFTWRTLYEANDHYYVNAVKISFLGKTTIIQGVSTPKLNLNNDFPQIKTDSVQYKDIERFRHFTNDWLIVAPENNNIIGDARYSLQANSTKPLWGIEIDTKNQEHHVTYIDTTREAMSLEYLLNRSEK